MTLTVTSSRIQVPADTTITSIPVNSTVLEPGSLIPSPETTPNQPVISLGNGTLSITSTPPGASVYLDSVMMGKTPVNLENLNYGSHLIEIKSPGYIPFSIQASVQEGSQVTLSPILVKSPSPIPLSPITVLIGLLFAGTIALVWRRR